MVKRVVFTLPGGPTMLRDLDSAGRFRKELIREGTCQDQ